MVWDVMGQTLALLGVMFGYVWENSVLCVCFIGEANSSNKSKQIVCVAYNVSLHILSTWLPCCTERATRQNDDVDAGRVGILGRAPRKVYLANGNQDVMYVLHCTATIQECVLLCPINVVFSCVPPKPVDVPLNILKPILL